ncbi:hypothetical protein HU200_037370 [Digitaria exilis]|uniref:C2H2-type domain-containing protein n=1 Tax=Digitaria exilis TaxID=1010633 RepID=A0A835BDB6_9POAL|nr:hypothetical protein HU200_037370 [Digitaria exilis]
MAKKYYYCWGMSSALSARTGGAAATTTNIRSWPSPAVHGGEQQPSWEEVAFARDAAGQLGGCVWPPRSYTCTFCQREFRSAQALGGHMNVHRRDRARLRHCTSPDDLVDDDEAPPPPPPHKQQLPPPPPAAAHNNLLVQDDASTLFISRANKQPLLMSGSADGTPISLSAACDHQQQQAAASSHIAATIMRMRESKNKLVISIPAPAAAATAGMSKDALLAVADYQKEEEEKEIIVAERTKRRRLVVHHHQQQQQQPDLDAPLFFLRPPPLAASNNCGVEHDDAKVPNRVIITSPTSPNSLHLAGRQEVDLELRLGTS